MSACVSSPVAARAPASGANAPRARRSVACAARADRSADEAKSVSVADRLRGAAVATAAAAALVACAPDAALANAFDGDLSPTNGPLKSLPKGARAPRPPRVPSRDFRSFLVLRIGRSGGVGERHPDDTQRHHFGRVCRKFRAPTRRNPKLTRASFLLSTTAELTEPDEIFREDFTVRFAGFEVDHKYLVGALVLGQAVGFVGSAVGGNEARKKGEQVSQLNQKLLKVNAELRREMREAGIGPYQPIPASRFIEKSVDSTDEDDETVARVISSLKSGKRMLKEGDNEGALRDFETALADIERNATSFNEGWKAARKAHRGMGAALERLGRFPEALASMKLVLALAAEHDDHSGETDALGVIADIYADMDMLEDAAEYYDKYFNSLQEEDARNAEAAEREKVRALTN